MREKILAHPIRWLIGLCACLVFFGCFGFPIYNFTTGRRFGSWYLLLALCFFYYEIGQILGVLHSRCKVRRSAALALGMTLLGLACRDMAQLGDPTLYLLTDHTAFYERYGWEYLCPVRGDGEEQDSRMYIHRQTEK